MLVYMHGGLLPPGKSQGNLTLQQTCNTTCVFLKLRLVILGHICNETGAPDTQPLVIQKCIFGITKNQVLTFHWHLPIDVLEEKNTERQIQARGK